MVYHEVLFWDLFFSLVSLSMTFHYTWQIYIHMLVATCWQMTQHCTHLSGKDTMQIRSNMQESLTRYPIGVRIIIWSLIRSGPGLRQSLPDRNTSCDPYHSISFRVHTDGVKIDQVSEHPRPLGITIDNKLRWDTHTHMHADIYTHPHTYYHETIKQTWNIKQTNLTFSHIIYNPYLTGKTIRNS